MYLYIYIPFVGVGCMWKKGIDRYISIMQSEYDWLICIKYSISTLLIYIYILLY